MPNYGYTPIGANASPLNGIWAQEINVTAAGTLASISIYLQTSSTPTVALGLYSNQAGTPDVPLTLLASGSGSPSSGVTGWFTVSMSYSLSAGLYWIAVQASITNSIQGYYDSGQTGGNIYYQTSQAWTGSLPGTYPSGNTLSNDQFSFYATVSGNTVNLGSVTLASALGIKPAPTVVGKMPGTTLGAAFGIKPAPVMVGKLPSTNLAASLGITSASIGKFILSGISMQGHFGMTPAPHLSGGTPVVGAALFIFCDTFGNHRVATPQGIQ